MDFLLEDKHLYVYRKSDRGCIKVKWIKKILLISSSV